MIKDKFIAELVIDVKANPLSRIFSDDRILDACLQVSETITEQDMEMLMNRQNDWCDRCAACCKLPPQVEVITEEILRIAKYKQMSPAKLMKQYKIKPTGGKRFQDGPEDKRRIYYHIQGRPCTFFQEPNICTIYDVRPGACAGFPAVGIVGNALTGGKIPHYDYCHIIKTWNVSRVLGLLAESDRQQRYEQRAKSKQQATSRSTD